LTATPASASQINLGWTDGGGNETAVLIERCAGNNCTNFAQVASVGGNVTSYSDTGLANNTFYRYRLRSTNGTVNSGYSNIAKAKTLNR